MLLVALWRAKQKLLQKQTWGEKKTVASRASPVDDENRSTLCIIAVILAKHVIDAMMIGWKKNTKLIDITLSDKPTHASRTAPQKTHATSANNRKDNETIRGEDGERE